MVRKTWLFSLGMLAVLGLWMAPKAISFDGDCEKDDAGALLADDLVADEHEEGDEDEKEGELFADHHEGEGEDEEEEAELFADHHEGDEDEEEEGELFADHHEGEEDEEEEAELFADHHEGEDDKEEGELLAECTCGKGEDCDCGAEADAEDAAELLAECTCGKGEDCDCGAGDAEEAELLLIA